MVTVGSLLMASYAILNFLGHPLPSTCDFKTEYTFEWEYSGSSILFQGALKEQKNSFYTFGNIICVAASLWDFITLLLYCYKIRTFRKIPALQQNAVWRKIMFILQHIIIITLFYQISFLVLCAAISAITYIPNIGKIANYTMLNALIGNILILSASSRLSWFPHHLQTQNKSRYGPFGWLQGW